MRSTTSLKPDAVTAVDYIVAALLCFCLYLGSAVILDARGATTHFGADSFLYQELVHGSAHDRIVRFHPLILGAALAWMKLFGWLQGWIEPALILKALFAAVGAGGAAAAVAAFSTFMPRREALLSGAVYAVCLGVLYFASIEESKIVTATLSSAYIAIYLRVREGAARLPVLIAIFFAACLNEITSCFLAVIPVVDCLIRYGWRWWSHARLLLHVITGATALAVLEFLSRVAVPGRDSEGASHASMFLYYFFKGDHGLSSLYSFLCNWFAFNLVAPGSATFYADPALRTAGYFGPGLAQYLSRPLSLLAILPLSAMFVFGVLKAGAKDRAGVLFALAAYSSIRGAFFFAFNPAEPLLFSPAVTLAHVMILLVPFVETGFRWRGVVLAASACAIFLANGGFIIGI